MKKNVLKVDVDRWFSNRKVRICSMAARGFLLELKMLSTEDGYLLVNGLPMSDDHIRSMTGCTKSNLMMWMRELGDVGIFAVDDRGLYFPDMVKEEKNKVSTVKLNREPKTLIEKALATGSPKIGAEVKIRKVIQHAAVSEPVIHAQKLPKALAPKSKPLEWYKTKAGWQQEGQRQGMSMGADDDFESFQLRLSTRIPEGAHLDYVPEYIAKRVREKNAADNPKKDT